MASRATEIGRYALVGAAGALGGGMLVVRLTDVMPRMMTAMMETMHARMEAAGINPAEMWRRMMEGFGEAPSPPVADPTPAPPPR